MDEKKPTVSSVAPAKTALIVLKIGIGETAANAKTTFIKEGNGKKYNTVTITKPIP